MGQCTSHVGQLTQPVDAASSISHASQPALTHPILICGCWIAGFVSCTPFAVAWHELTHVVAAWVVALLPDNDTLAKEIIGTLKWVVANTAHLPAYLIAGGCKTERAIPCITLALPPNLHPSHWRISIARHSGWVASTVLVTLIYCIAVAVPSSTAAADNATPVTVMTAAALYGAVTSSFIVLLGALTSDLMDLQPSLSSSLIPAGTASVYSKKLGNVSCGGGGGGMTATICFFCGNIGLLVAAAAGSAVDMMSVLRSQIAISSQRGAQSGGLVSLVEAAPGDEANEANSNTHGNGGGSGKRAVIDGVRSRCAPGKRDHLSVELHRRFGRALGRAPRLAGGHGIFVGHTRFATSSQPSEGESHPHQWSPPFNTPVWRTHPATGRLEVAAEKFGVWITHNGDFDFWRLMGQDRTHSDIAAFLNAALGSPSPARCDSVRVAGMIELLRTQGLWFPSLRLAYYDSAVDCSFSDVVASADLSYGSKSGVTGRKSDAEGGGSRRVATRAELQALAAALEAAFTRLIADIEPDDPATLALPHVLDEDVVANRGSVAAVMNGSMYGGAGNMGMSLHGGADGGAVADIGKEGSAHGGIYASRGLPGFGVSGGIGGGRLSVMPNEDAVATAAIGAGSDDDEDGDGTAAFLRERRPSFDGLMAGGERSLAGAVLAATMRAVVQRAAQDHQGQSVYGSVYGSMHGSMHGAGGNIAGTPSVTPALDAAPRVYMNASHQGSGSQHAAAGGMIVGSPPDWRATPWMSVQHGSLDVRRRSGAMVHGFHPSSYNDPSALVVGSPPQRVSMLTQTIAGKERATAQIPEQKIRGGNAVPASIAPAASVEQHHQQQHAAKPGSMNAAAGLNAGATAASAVARSACSATAGGVAAANGGGGGAAASHGPRPDVPVSYGQEAINIACALGWARDRSARAAMVSALVEAAREHLESTPGWSAWKATVPSLERLVKMALSYFIANDLYTASCRFLKHAKGSFGLAILCSLEPDRLCMGAWGQPMAMSFSQAHHAVLYGSETNCAMIPIATRPGAAPAGSQSDGSSMDEVSNWMPDVSPTPPRAKPAAAAAAATVAMTGAARVNPPPSADQRRVQVRHVQDRVADTISLHGSTVELIRDSPRHSGTYVALGGAGGGANITNPLASQSLHAATLSSHNNIDPAAVLHGPQVISGSVPGPRGHGTYSAYAIAAAAGGGGLGTSPAMPINMPSGPRYHGSRASRMNGVGIYSTSPLRGQPLGESVEAPPLRGYRSPPNMAMNGDFIVESELRDVVRGYENGGMGIMPPTPEMATTGFVALTMAPEDEEVVVENGWGPAFATHRIDIDEGSGEMMQLVLTDPTDSASAVDNADGWCMFRVQPFVRLRVFQLRTGTEVDTREDFEAQERIVQLVNNPYVSFNPKMDLTPGRDYVADDLKDVSRVLSLVRDTWTDPNSLNRQTAEDLFEMLDKLVQFVMTGGASASERPGVDVLITGVESSLWIAEQWAGDLKLVFPQLSVQAVSANKVISVLGNARGRIPPTGSTFCRSSSSFLADHHTLCIAVSQSGQTFPTIHASRILNQLLPGRVFALCGSVDTKMALALGQRVALHSPFTRRVFTSCAGGRCAEPPSVVCVALHQTMSELLAFLVVRMRMTSVCASGRPLGMILSKEDMVDLRAIRDRFIDISAPQLTGYDAAGKSYESEHHFSLVNQGRRWALHVIESPTAWVLSLIHILATVVSGWPVVYAVVHGICLAVKANKTIDLAVSKVALAIDSVIYMFLPIIYAVLLRIIQGRPIWHRMGKRTIVVADVPYVHQIIETFVSKMYALSYGIASVEVHGANPVDHFVHRFTHRVVRGLLIALGRPDGRLYSQTKSESWVLLGLLQAKVITSWGHQPEVVSIGHNPYHPSVVDYHLQLPTNRPRLLIEALEHNTGAVDPNQLWASRRHMVTSKFPLHHKAHELLQEMGDATGDYNPSFRYNNPSVKVKKTTPTPTPTATSNGVAAAQANGNGRMGSVSTPVTIPRNASAGAVGLPQGPNGSAKPSGRAMADRSSLPPLPLPPVAPPPPPAAPLPLVLSSGPTGSSARSPFSLGRRTSRLIRGPCNAYSKLTGEAILNSPAAELRPLLGLDSKHLVGGHLLYGIFKKAELRNMWEKVGVVRQLASVLSTKKISESVAREAVAAVGSTLEDVLHKQTVMEQLLESRYLSLERLIAFMVMFHAMARRTADWWPLTFDIARSQSGLRVATTAAPVTASELEQSLAETLAGDVVEAAARRGEAASRDRVRQILTTYIRRRAAASAVTSERAQ